MWQEDHYDPTTNVTADPRNGNQDFFLFDEEPEEENIIRISASSLAPAKEALTQHLCIVTGTNHPFNHMIVDLVAPALGLPPEQCERTIAVIAAVVGKTPEKSLAAIGRKYPGKNGTLERATISKQAREIAKHPLVKAIRSYAHCGSNERSQQARENRIKVINKQQILCKPTPTQQKRASHFLARI